MEEEVVSKGTAVAACTAMTLSYVAILYAPTLILRLPPPPSFNSFMIRRFVCAAISSIVSLLICALILPIRRKEASVLLGVYGIQVDPIWQAVVFPVFLTSLMYAGSLVLKSLVLVESWRDNVNHGEGVSLECIKIIVQKLIASIVSVTSNVLAWRNFVVAPLTEELVFRACMIPLLLCGGFKPYTVIYLCPIFFSLAHLNHLMEFYSKQNYSLVKTSMVVGLQLGYTVIFGSYASFLFIRTGHLIAPLAAHMFCNFMGLPVLFSRRNGMVSIAFVAGMVGFLSLLFPMTRPDLYNYRSNNCKCWHGYCSWS
ncbi:CAAX prenyl protease 2 isoform X1 [Juglans microcarpa x Juglans regia]|uniref:CAAX prenyl protease 2 isoform X1 n=1 Tax=Juglans microcarpa x Juglans regia TaxID=2249226 RepID=UPI001B7F29D5|nr:CAAX prenyl protease 2 isoform X1 [Juglans microcarpa x Juglans regia]